MSNIIKAQWSDPKFRQQRMKDMANKERMKNISQFDINNNFIKKWDTLKSISEELNISRSALRNCIQGRTQTCANYIWRKE
jgi:hypothetical protein